MPVADGINPEFDGYGGQLVKQADVTLLGYPWGFASSAAVERADLAHYVPRTDPGGPSMSDAVNSIESDQLDPGGCQAYVYTERSYQPFIRDVFHQFSETRTGGAFTFMTGIGGFLQEFLYGYSGLRWEGSAVHLSPALSGPITGVTLRHLSWRGRTFTVAIHRDRARSRRQRRAAVDLDAGGHATVQPGHPVTIVTPAPPRAIREPTRCCAARQRVEHRARSAGAGGRRRVERDRLAAGQAAGDPDRAGERCLTPCRASPFAGAAPGHRCSSPTSTQPGPVETLRSRDYSTDPRRRRDLEDRRDGLHAQRPLDRHGQAPGDSRPRRAAAPDRGTGQQTVKTKSTPATPILPMVQELTVR